MSSTEDFPVYVYKVKRRNLPPDSLRSYSVKQSHSKEAPNIVITFNLQFHLDYYGLSENLELNSTHNFRLQLLHSLLQWLYSICLGE